MSYVHYKCKATCHRCGEHRTDSNIVWDAFMGMCVNASENMEQAYLKAQYFYELAEQGRLRLTFDPSDEFKVESTADRDLSMLNAKLCNICKEFPEREVSHAATEAAKDPIGAVKDLIHINREMMFLGFYAPECDFKPELRGSAKPSYEELLKQLVKTTNKLERLIGSQLA